MRYPILQPARLIKRENRFRVKIRLGDNEVTAHLANPGRLFELLVPGAAVWVSKSLNPNRKTPFSLELVRTEDALVSINSQVPNTLINEALLNHTIPEIHDYIHFHREVKAGKSRFDFRITSNGSLTWLEVKSVTLVSNGIAAFPDAPTLRGQRHLAELITLTQNGAKSAVIFVVQRNDATSFSPNDKTDPEFGRILRQADLAGVTILAKGCKVTTSDITLDHNLPVIL